MREFSLIVKGKDNCDLLSREGRLVLSSFVLMNFYTLKGVLKTNALMM